MNISAKVIQGHLRVLDIQSTISQILHQEQSQKVKVFINQPILAKREVKFLFVEFSLWAKREAKIICLDFCEEIDQNSLRRRCWTFRKTLFQQKRSITPIRNFPQWGVSL